MKETITITQYIPSIKQKSSSLLLNTAFGGADGALSSIGAFATGEGTVLPPGAPDGCCIGFPCSLEKLFPGTEDPGKGRTEAAEF